ncbi:MAG: hypothetical protein L6U16_06690 [Porphyromonadaceae bacterium]|nr:MAG: hypothetical protein L6U16_06690 [Porphyromonadaceae bacterium]
MNADAIAAALGALTFICKLGGVGAIWGGIFGGRRGVGECDAEFLAQGSILRVKGWTNELFLPERLRFEKSFSFESFFAS